jgi:DNA-binding transcriptional regulator GbsR (MarR family)
MLAIEPDALTVAYVQEFLKIGEGWYHGWIVRETGRTSMPQRADSRDAAERFALKLTENGMQRMSARVLAAFLFTGQDTLTMGELAEELGVSAGSVSAALKGLNGVGLIERVPAPGSRREHYRLRDNAWATLFTSQNTVIQVMMDAARDGIAATSRTSPARSRLTQMRGFYEFLLAEIPTLLNKWQRQQRTTP